MRCWLGSGEARVETGFHRIGTSSCQPIQGDEFNFKLNSQYELCCMILNYVIMFTLLESDLQRYWYEYCNKTYKDHKSIMPKVCQEKGVCVGYVCWCNNIWVFMKSFKHITSLLMSYRLALCYIIQTFENCECDHKLNVINKLFTKLVLILWVWFVLSRKG